MEYIEIDLTMAPIEPYRDLLIYKLGDEGPYDSFEETAQGVKAYVPRAQYNPAFVDEAIAALQEDAGVPLQIEYTAQPLPDKDWNAEWEKNYPMVMVEDFCCVRAPFHPKPKAAVRDIIINPKMAFGTAHHATTYMMLCLLHQMPLQGVSLLDMGCGTAVLSIFAAQEGATHVEAVDIDDWAYRNAMENVELNGCAATVHCRLGGAEILQQYKPFDVVAANINKNILLRDMPAYGTVLQEGGALLLSGFYENDISDIVAAAEGCGLHHVHTLLRDDWAALQLTKTS